jgi:hypothetical protein
MSKLSVYDGSDNDPSNEILLQQQLMGQMLQLNQQAQQKLAAKQKEHSEHIEDLRKTLNEALAQVRAVQNNNRLITVNMLDTMLKTSSMGKFSRLHHVDPQKVPHPTVPNGVNGYEPGIVKRWLAENGYDIPADLRYVD